MLERVAADTEEFERCVTRLTALRAVHARLQRNAMKSLDADRIRESMQTLQASLGSGWFNLKARGAFATLCATLQGHIDNAAQQSGEMGQMLQALFTQLNTEFGFTLALPPPPDMNTFKAELTLIEQGYSRYFSVTRSIRLNSSAFSEQFQRMLVSKLRVVFENASSEIETWNQAAQTQIDNQFRERRRGFKRRRESLERIQLATGDLEHKLTEVENQDARLMGLMERAYMMATALRNRAERGPMVEVPAVVGLTLNSRAGERLHGGPAG
jgi:hypothetical protein